MTEYDAMVQTYILMAMFPMFCFVIFLGYHIDFILHHTQKRMFAWFMNKQTARINKGLHEYKKKVFDAVHRHGDSVNRPLEILDVGSGSAPNLSYLPGKSRLVCLEPNRNFNGYIEGKMKKCDAVDSYEVVNGFAEYMPLHNDQFDVVICTLALCSIWDMDHALIEIKRVLKPGGLFVFLEPVRADKTSLLSDVQDIICPFNYMLFDGFSITKNTAEEIKKAGFKDIALESIQPKVLPFWARPCIVGTARK